VDVAILNAAPQDQQAHVLAGAEWVGFTRPRPSPEAVRLVVIAGPESVMCADRTVGV
jgi:hypothetical protein